MKKILLVDDDEAFCDVASQMLSMLGHEVVVENTLAEASSRLDNETFSHILLDFMLPDGSGLHVIDRFRGEPEAPYISLVTGHPTVKTMMSGLTGPKVNYLIKPLTKSMLEQALSADEPRAVAADSSNKHFGCLVGESPAMLHLYEMIERVSKTTANVMLMGESGAGKEVVAEAIHNSSKARGPLITANCGAFAKDLIGSELFGHEKGSFTGAVARKAGVFERADGGTLFLDEITEMPLDSQPNLLRVLETERVTRVGGSAEFPVKCRVISATNRNEAELAESRVLREDLYFRLAVFPILIPPLRERKSDVGVLANTFLAELNREHGTQFSLSDSHIEQLEAYEWPGNVRELRHAIHRAFIMSDAATNLLILPRELASPFSRSKKSSNNIIAGQRIDDVERELIRVTLEQLAGDKPAAADMLGISLKTLYNRLNKYESLQVS